jgi:hypothetical protein
VSDVLVCETLSEFIQVTEVPMPTVSGLAPKALPPWAAAFWEMLITGVDVAGAPPLAMGDGDVELV